MNKKASLACYGTILSVNDQSFYFVPDANKKVIWKVAYSGNSLLRSDYVDPDYPIHVNQYVGVVATNENGLKVYDANSPIFLELISDEIVQEESVSRKTR